MPYASFAMYPFEPVRADWERLWSAVHERVPWTPASLRWDGAVHEHWFDPECAVAQACGWPVVTTLHGHVAVVGAFSLALGDAEGHRYRSVVLANQPRSLDEIVTAGSIAAATAPDSLSGWVSLLAAAVGPGGVWPGQVRWTGGHVESLRALRDGHAVVASVDELSLAFVRRHSPDLAAGLHEVGRGPWVPSLPVVVRAGTPARRIEQLRDAIVNALSERELGTVRDELFLDGFVALDDSAYQPLIALAPRAECRNVRTGYFTRTTRVLDAGFRPVIMQGGMFG